MAGDDFGWSVAIKNDTISVGCPFDYVDGNKTGSAYLFDNLPGDLDADSDVDFFDFAVLAGFWRQNNPLADIAPAPAGDGFVDMKDLAVLCDNWLAGK